MYQQNLQDFWHHFITVGETWKYYYIRETKAQPKQWTGRGESAPKTVKTVFSAGNVMAMVFWDSKGNILID